MSSLKKSTKFEWIFLKVIFASYTDQIILWNFKCIRMPGLWFISKEN